MSSLNDLTPEEIEQLKADPEFRALFHADDDPYGYPEPANRDNLLKFFRDILKLDPKKHNDTSKIGFLKDGEIGWLSLPIRNYLSLANYCDTEGYSTVATYLRGKSNITVNSSLSRKAKFLETAISQKRVSQNIVPRTVETKSGIFGSKTVESGGEE